MNDWDRIRTEIDASGLSARSKDQIWTLSEYFPAWLDHHAMNVRPVTKGDFERFLGSDDWGLARGPRPACVGVREARGGRELLHAPPGAVGVVRYRPARPCRTALTSWQGHRATSAATSAGDGVAASSGMA